MANALHNIICFEAEWEYRYDKCHGKHHAITLEDEDGDIDLSEPLKRWQMVSLSRYYNTTQIW